MHENKTQPPKTSNKKLTWLLSKVINSSVLSKFIKIGGKSPFQICVSSHLTHFVFSCSPGIFISKPENIVISLHAPLVPHLVPQPFRYFDYFHDFIFLSLCNIVIIFVLMFTGGYLIFLISWVCTQFFFFKKSCSGFSLYNLILVDYCHSGALKVLAHQALIPGKAPCWCQSLFLNLFPTGSPNCSRYCCTQISLSLPPLLHTYVHALSSYRHPPPIDEGS